MATPDFQGDDFQRDIYVRDDVVSTSGVAVVCRSELGPGVGRCVTDGKQGVMVTFSLVLAV